jgi:hypothetical protein
VWVELQIASPQLVTETMIKVSSQKCGPPESEARAAVAGG